MGRVTKLTIFPFLALLVLIISTPATSPGQQSKVAQVIYITLTRACGCTLERCQAGDMVVGNIFNGARQGLLKRIDYSTDKETARIYIKKYRVPQASALLFLDAQGNLLWMALGELSESTIQEKLRSFGG